MENSNCSKSSELVPTNPLKLSAENSICLIIENELPSYYIFLYFF